MTHERLTNRECPCESCQTYPLSHIKLLRNWEGRRIQKIIYIYIILQPLRGGGLRIKDLSEAERERRMHILRLFLKSYLKFQKHFEVPSSLELMIKDGLTSTREDAA